MIDIIPLIAPRDRALTPHPLADADRADIDARTVGRTAEELRQDVRTVRCADAVRGAAA